MYAYRISKKYAKEGEMNMEKNVVKEEKMIDEKVLECYYNICRYYNKKDTLIRDFIRKK